MKTYGICGSPRVPILYVFRFFYFDFIFENTLTHEALHTEIRKPVINRNTHEEDRRKEWRKLRALSGWISWIESFVGQLRLLVKLWHVGEDTIYRSRV
ncbi:hypothetical protein T4C_11915 [Trichinella pseudospiralis]|nr:hypothetical protein T4C_11915 [Trichinella pseudospiralis]